jgi:nucleoside-diphosphate-sugar epimerase
MKRVLVTGASGLIGRHCLPLLSAKGHEIHAVRWHKTSAAIPDVAGVSWHHLDLIQPGCPTEAIREVRPDAVLHLAWCAVPGKFWETPENIDWLRASLELVSAFAESGGGRIVAAGSCAEYALDSGECIENQTPLAPTTLYGTCKRALDEILLRLNFPATVSAACGRIFFLYGPYEDASRVIAYVIRSLLKGEPALCSEGRDVLDFLHVEDAASAFVALLESDIRGPVNIGSGNRIELKDVFHEIGRQLGRPELIRVGARAAHSQKFRIWANTEKLRSESGWLPRYDLSRGIAETIEWWRKQEPNAEPAALDQETRNLSPT